MSSVERKGLEDLGLELEYRSDGSSTLHDFYIPCLEVSTTYKRAVGYFTSTALTLEILSNVVDEGRLSMT